MVAVLTNLPNAFIQHNKPYYNLKYFMCAKNKIINEVVTLIRLDSSRIPGINFLTNRGNWNLIYKFLLLNHD